MIIIGIIMLIAKKLYGNTRIEDMIHEENQMKLQLIEESERLQGLRP